MPRAKKVATPEPTKKEKKINTKVELRKALKIIEKEIETEEVNSYIIIVGKGTKTRSAICGTMKEVSQSLAEVMTRNEFFSQASRIASQFVRFFGDKSN